jgi:patatin-like phospholipase/acyl hydrolase
MTTNIENNTYRYEFSKEFTEKLYYFSKIHEYDDLKDYKDAWDIWVNDNIEEIMIETRMLESNGYTNNVLNKMYKSARYYLRKKRTTEKKEPVKRRPYSGVDRNLLRIMDSFISSSNSNNSNNKKSIKPSESFASFCEIHSKDISDVINKINETHSDANSDSISHSIPSSILMDKIKKTYKNRYFIYSKANNN